jgi:hypothetical protein
MKSSCHSPVSFLHLLSITLDFRLRKLTQFLITTNSMLQLPVSELFFITALHGPRRKQNILLGGVFTVPLPSTGRPIVARVGFRGNLFTETLPSNVCTRHNIFHCCHLLLLFINSCKYLAEVHNASIAM